MKSTCIAIAVFLFCVGNGNVRGAEPIAAQSKSITLLDEQVTPITEPPCSYCSTQHVKSLIRGDDRVISWLRADHNGGAFPIRLFLAGPRVVNDTYGHADGLCAGVGCFNGICWKAYTGQLMPVAATSNRIAVLATYKQFQRDVARYEEPEASWVYFALKTFGTMPPKHGGKAIVASRMIAVIQGWDVTAKEITAQQRAAKKAGANGCVVAFDKIEQSWSPKVVRWK